MRNVSILDVRPAPDVVDPALDVDVKIEFEYQREAPLLIQGTLLLNKLGIGYAHERPARSEYRLSGRGRNGFDQDARMLTLRVPLSARAIDRIGDAREAREDGDVVLTLALGARVLKVSTHTPDRVGVALDGGQGERFLGRLVRQDGSADLAMLAVANGAYLAEIEWAEQPVPITVPASRWAQVFAPAFGLGRSLLFEYPVPAPEAEEGSPEWMGRAVEDLRAMEALMDAGDWAGVVRTSREVAEVLRGNRGAEVAKVLETDGVAEDAATEVISAMNGLFQYASKFAHALDKKQGLRSRMNVSKEDAQLAFAAASATVNLVAAKMKRARSVSP